MVTNIVKKVKELGNRLGVFNILKLSRNPEEEEGTRKGKRKQYEQQVSRNLIKYKQIVHM